MAKWLKDTVSCVFPIVGILLNDEILLILFLLKKEMKDFKMNNLKVER